MPTQIDKDACREAYNQVRDDNSDTSWAAFKYEDSVIVPAGVGTDYRDFKQLCTDDVPLFGFVRFLTGDAMSKRAKFTLITWIGERVGGLQRAKISTDKTLVKDVVQVGAGPAGPVPVPGGSPNSDLCRTLPRSSWSATRGSWRRSTCAPS
uniref:Coactosin-like protein n=1 Tax=Poecilia reticulata TaxID=8081 RepID=A0A3P9MUD5_POERE